MDSLNVCLPPLWLGLYCMQQIVTLAYITVKGPIQCPRKPQILPRRADEAYRPLGGFLECKALGKPSVMRRRSSGLAEVPRR